MDHILEILSVFFAWLTSLQHVGHRVASNIYNDLQCHFFIRTACWNLLRVLHAGKSDDGLPQLCADGDRQVGWRDWESGLLTSKTWQDSKTRTTHTKSYKANKLTASWRDWLICSEDTGLRFAQRGEKKYLCSHAWFSDAVDAGRLRHKNLGAGPNLPKYSFSTSILFRVGGTSQWMWESRKPAQSSSLKQKKINAKVRREPASPQCLHLPLHFVPVDLTVICAYLRKSKKITSLRKKIEYVWICWKSN